MKEVLASDLKKGDLIYYADTYREVLDEHPREVHGTYYRRTKTYMAPVPEHSGDLDIGTRSYIATNVKVLLLYRKDNL